MYLLGVIVQVKWSQFPFNGWI